MSIVGLMMRLAGKAAGTAAGIASQGASALGRGSSMKRIRRANDESRMVHAAGAVEPGDVLVSCERGIVAGGDAASRTAYACASVGQALAAGTPVVVVHEGDGGLTRAMERAFGSDMCLWADASNMAYEPVADLGSPEAASLICEAMGDGLQAAEAGVYLQALGTILARKGIPIYLRMLESCPHGRLAGIIDSLEGAGRVDPAEAMCLRRDVDASPAAAGAVRSFLRNAVAQGPVFADKPHLANARSLRRHAQSGRGVFGVDVGTTGKQALASILAADMARAARDGFPLHLVLSAHALDRDRALLRAIRDTGMPFTLLAEDFDRFAGSRDEARELFSLADACVFMRHGIASAPIISELLGEYDKIEASVQRSSGGGLGMLGYSHSANSGVTEAMKREARVKPEEIVALDADAAECFVTLRASPEIYRCSLAGPAQ